MARRLGSEPQLLAAGLEARLVEDVAELTAGEDLDAGDVRSDSGPQIASDVRVSVIDDDATVRLMLRRLLEREGWAVVDSSSSEGPLAIFGSSEPNLVVIDADMPGRRASSSSGSSAIGASGFPSCFSPGHRPQIWLGPPTNSVSGCSPRPPQRPSSTTVGRW